jgi:glyoxylase-like metal-dependent hydrolase (beta-lactamase superfamily II)
VSYPPGHLFADVTRAQIEQALRQLALPVDHVTTPYTHLYVDTGAHQVLVDVGAGNLAPSAGRLRRNLIAAGADPAAIDTVIITHAHPAHVGGALDDDGRPVYANAGYVLWKNEWDFWTSEAAFAKAPERQVTVARKSLEPIRDRMRLVDHKQEIVPGIAVLPAPGHTPGHMVVSVSSGGEHLLYVGDTVFHPLHLERPDWTPIYDILPQEAAATKRRVFDLAAEGDALVIGQHFPPFPSLGRVVKQGRGWHWHPIETAQ